MDSEDDIHGAESVDDDFFSGETVVDSDDGDATGSIMILMILMIRFRIVIRLNLLKLAICHSGLMIGMYASSFRFLEILYMLKHKVIMNVHKSRLLLSLIVKEQRRLFFFR